MGSSSASVPPRYRVDLTPRAKRELASIPRPEQERLDRAILALGDEPRPPGSRRVQGTDLLRIRVGPYRVLYRVKDDVLLVLVVRIGPRGSVYRRLERL